MLHHSLRLSGGRIVAAALLAVLFVHGNSAFGQGTVAKKKKPQYSGGDISVPAAHAAEPAIEFSAKRASRYLDDGAVAWGRERKCVSCHTNGSYLFIRPSLTPLLGPPSQEVHKLFLNQLESLSTTPSEKLRKNGTRPAQAIYIAAGLAQWDVHVGRKSSPETARALNLMFELQNEKGTWHSLTCWPPFESSAYHLAHVAAMAVAAAPEWSASVKDTPVQKRVERLMTYLRDSPPPHDYARVLRLWSALRVPGILSEAQKKETLALIRNSQRDDGGWSLRSFATPEQWGDGNRAKRLKAETKLQSSQSDGHMTGLALLVMQEAGVSGDDPALRRGLDWLRTNQRESGRWWTRSLNTDNWHFITYSGTAYSLLALQNAQARE